MITVHHLEYSQSFRILWLMEELGVPYDVKVYERDPETRLAPTAYKKLSPLGTAPVITDGKLVLSETNAVIDYILDKHASASLRPKATSKYRAKYLFWFHAAQGSMMPLVLTNTVFTVSGARAPFFIKPIANKIAAQVKHAFLKPRMDALLKIAEADLSKTKFLAGNRITAADISMCYTMESAEKIGFVTDAHPNCKRWIKDVSARPAFKAARIKDGRDTILFSL